MLGMLKGAVEYLSVRCGLKGRKGGVLVEYIILVSVIALSMAILAAVTGYRDQVAQKFNNANAALSTY